MTTIHMTIFDDMGCRGTAWATTSYEKGAVGLVHAVNPLFRPNSPILNPLCPPLLFFIFCPTKKRFEDVFLEIATFITYHGLTTKGDLAINSVRINLFSLIVILHFFLL